MLLIPLIQEVSNSSVDCTHYLWYTSILFDEQYIIKATLEEFGSFLCHVMVLGETGQNSSIPIERQVFDRMACFDDRH